MNKDIMTMVGFTKEMSRVEAKRCPICGTEIDESSFKDTLSLNEYHISGLCQKCQDNFFGC